MPEGDKDIVQRYLSYILEQVDLGQHDQKVYHELHGSFTWSELLHAVTKGTDIGKRYVKSLAEAAREDGTSLEEYLGSGVQE